MHGEYTVAVVCPYRPVPCMCDDERSLIPVQCICCNDEAVTGSVHGNDCHSSGI